MQVVDLLELQEPERIQIEWEKAITQASGKQLFKDQSLGIQFTVPGGWLLQQPPKTAEISPDVVATGPQTGKIPSAISLTISDTNGRTFVQVVEDKITSLQPHIDIGALEIETERNSIINGRNVNFMFLEGIWSINDETMSIAFMEATIYNIDKIYTFSLANDDHIAFAGQIELLRESVRSFEIIDEIVSDEEDTEVITGSDMTKEEFLALADDRQQEFDKEQGGCLIATAAYGSEMAPQIQFLREIRDNTVLQTQFGTAFMAGFNQFYYSFSPTVADYERENPMFKEAVKLTLTPLLTSLAILNYVDIDTEQEMLGYGIGVILLNIGMYFVAPAAVIIAIKNRRK